MDAHKLYYMFYSSNKLTEHFFDDEINKIITEIISDIRNKVKGRPDILDPLPPSKYK